MLGLGALVRAFLLEGLTGLLGHTLARGLIGHGCPVRLGAWTVPVIRRYATSASCCIRASFVGRIHWRQRWPHVTGANTSWNAPSSHPAPARNSWLKHRIQMIRASSTTVSRRSILPTGNLASLC